MSINSLFNIGNGALQLNQLALQTTGHNIANVNAQGYSRQRVYAETETPFMSEVGPLGAGVRAKEINRVYDRFLNYQIKGERQNYGRLGGEKDAMARVEGIFNELAGTGISDGLAKFFSAVKDLSNNPSGVIERSQVLSNAGSLTAIINKKASDLVALRNTIDSDIGNGMRDINAIAAQIADLNGKIAGQEVGGGNANDLRDKRDSLMADLSKVIDFDTFEDSSGQVSIFVGRGNLLVDRNRYNTLSGVPNGANANLQDIYISNGGTNINITSFIQAGRLKGLVNIRDVTAPDFQNRLNTFAKALADNFNTQHAAGFGLDGSTGLNFFSTTAGNEAATISVAVTDKNRIAAAAANPTTTSGPGDNGNALLLVGVQSTKYAALGNAVLSDYYHTMISDAGIRSQSSIKSYEFQGITVQQLENGIQSVSGVSMDEEAMNLQKFQKAFQASAKVITTADELLQTILNIKR